MAAVHGILGLGLVVLAVGGAAVAVRPDDERLRSMADLAVGVLALQVVLGFFLVTGTGPDVGAAHQFLPALALGGAVAARLVTGPRRAVSVGLASLAIAAVAVVAAVTGYTS